MSSRATPVFSLFTEPWLPVSLPNGDNAEWSLAETLIRAHEARRLNEPSPLAYTALLRMLLAVLHRAFDGPRNPRQWKDLYVTGRFDPETIDAYLRSHSSRFDLFDPERPFAQADASVAMTDDSPVTRLLMERTSGNNPTLFNHSWDEQPPALTPGEAARALLTAHAYAFAGSGGRFLQSPMVAGYAITFEGANLFQTLLLNLFGYNDQLLKCLGLKATDDAPWWEWRADPPVTKDGLWPRGLTDLLTWRSRRIRLLPASDGSVRRVQYSQGYVLRDPELRLRDPFKRYVRVESGDSAGASFPKNFSGGRALWRDLDTLIEHAGQLDLGSEDQNERPAIVAWVETVTGLLADADQPQPTIVATGLVKETEATARLWRMERLPLPISLLHDPDKRQLVKQAIDVATEVGRTLFEAGKSYALQSLMYAEKEPEKGGPKSEDVEKARIALKLDERYWSRLEPRFQRFLTDIDAESDRVVENWRHDVERVARSVYREASQQQGGSGLRWKGVVAGEARLNIGLAELGRRPNQGGATP